MRILLVGEFSGFYNNLKEGLRDLGHEVCLWANSDGYKNFSSDKLIYEASHSQIRKGFDIIEGLRGMRDYDIVQLVSPTPFTNKFNFNKKAIKILEKSNEKLFLSGAGMNTTILGDYLRNQHKYSELATIYKNSRLLEGSTKEDWKMTPKGQKFNNWIHEQIDGYIPIMYEYAHPYRLIDHKKLCRTIPLPFDLKNFKVVDNIVKDKVIFSYGLNRHLVKGSAVIIPAMEKLQERYPNDVKVIVQERMPIQEYLLYLETVNVVIDQAYSVSYGMNALYAMAKGRVVVGGGEEECLQEFGLTECPIVPINPNVDDIYNKLVMVLERKDEILEWGRRSREFVETHHDAVKIAAQYLEVWENA